MNMRCSRRWGRRCATSCLLDAWEKEGRLVQAVLRCVQCDAILDAGDATVCVGLASAVLTVQPWSARSCAHTAWVSEGERVAGSEYVPAYCLSDLVNNGQRAKEPGTHAHAAHAGVSVSIAAREPGVSRVPHVRDMRPELLEAATETHAGPQIHT